MAGSEEQTVTDGAPGVLVGRRVVSGTVRALYLMAAVLYVVWAVISRRVLPSVYAVVWLAVYGVTWFRPATRVDSYGVHRPVLRRQRRLIGWDEVAAVVRPGRFDATAALLLVSGETVRLVDVAATQAPQVAAIGGKDLQAPPPVPRPAAAVVTPRRATVADLERDLQRRTAALAADREQMAADLARSRRGLPQA